MLFNTIKKMAAYCKEYSQTVPAVRTRQYLLPLLAAVLDLAVATNEQFEDDYYLADCLLSFELLGDYYEMDGTIYRREYDRKIA